MERDTAISHGAAQYLHERLCLVSDAYTTVFCKTCGTIAQHVIDSSVFDKYICRICNGSSFGKMTIAYAYKLLTNYMAAMGIFLRFKLSTLEEHMQALASLGITPRIEDVIPTDADLEREERRAEHELPSLIDENYIEMDNAGPAERAEDDNTFEAREYWDNGVSDDYPTGPMEEYEPGEELDEYSGYDE